MKKESRSYYNLTTEATLPRDSSAKRKAKSREELIRKRRRLGFAMIGVGTGILGATQFMEAKRWKITNYPIKLKLKKAAAQAKNLELDDFAEIAMTAMGEEVQQEGLRHYGKVVLKRLKRQFDPTLKNKILDKASGAKDMAGAYYRDALQNAKSSIEFRKELPRVLKKPSFYDVRTQKSIKRAERHINYAKRLERIVAGSTPFGGKSTFKEDMDAGNVNTKKKNKEAAEIESGDNTKKKKSSMTIVYKKEPGPDPNFEVDKKNLKPIDAPEDNGEQSFGDDEKKSPFKKKSSSSKKSEKSEKSDSGKVKKSTGNTDEFQGEPTVDDPETDDRRMDTTDDPEYADSAAAETAPDELPKRSHPHHSSKAGPDDDGTHDEGGETAEPRKKGPSDKAEGDEEEGVRNGEDYEELPPEHEIEKDENGDPVEPEESPVEDDMESEDGAEETEGLEDGSKKDKKKLSSKAQKLKDIYKKARNKKEEEEDDDDPDAEEDETLLPVEDEEEEEGEVMLDKDGNPIPTEEDEEESTEDEPTGEGEDINFRPTMDSITTQANGI